MVSGDSPTKPGGPILGRWPICSAPRSFTSTAHRRLRPPESGGARTHPHHTACVFLGLRNIPSHPFLYGCRAIPLRGLYEADFRTYRNPDEIGAAASASAERSAVSGNRAFFSGAVTRPTSHRFPAPVTIPRAFRCSAISARDCSS